MQFNKPDLRGQTGITNQLRALREGISKISCHCINFLMIRFNRGVRIYLLTSAGLLLDYNQSEWQ